MGFIITTSDITKEKVDVIVNSLGIVTNHYGAICQSIIHASKGDELKKIIDGKNGKVSVGDTFITDSYGLPCKKILHLVTPFEKFDKDYVAFETALRDVLNTCRNLGYKSISLPILGTGANGYNHIEIQNILMAMCAGFADAYQEIDIRVVKKPVQLKKLPLNDIELEMMLDKEEGSIHRDINAFEASMDHYYKDRHLKLVREERDYNRVFFESSEPIIPAEWKKDGTDPNRPDIIFSKEEMEKMDLDDYLDKYLFRRYGFAIDKEDAAKKKIRIYVGNNNTKQGSKYLYDLKYGNAEVPNRVKMFKIALALEMSEKEVINFLTAFGIHPSVRIPLEICLMKCIERGIYNMNSIDDELRNRHLATLFE